MLSLQHRSFGVDLLEVLVGVHVDSIWYDRIGPRVLEEIMHDPGYE
jgi:hypothetical protein